VPTPASLPRVQLIFLSALLLGVALALSWWLRTGRYRRPEETGPLPRHVWVVPAIPFVGVLVALALEDRPWPVVPPYLLLVPAAAALAAVDADVRRLPNALTVPLVPVELVLLALASWATGDAVALRRALVATVFVGGGFVLVALLLHGRSIGMGDAKLMLSLAPALAWLGWGQLIVGIWLGFVLGGLAALGLLVTRRATGSTHLAFGPWLVGGALLAISLA